MTFDPVPRWATGDDYPEVAKIMEHVRLPFYCMNCYRKRPTTYPTPNFGPLCVGCVAEMRSVK